MDIMQDDDFQKYLEKKGWTVECESPLEIRHEEGSFATMYAAKILLNELHEQYKDENGISNNKEEYSHQTAFEQLQKLFNSMEQYVHAACTQEIQDKNRGIATEDGLSSEAYALWETAYNLTFNKNMSHKIKDCLNELNIELDYYDPDTSYKEDVLAYYEAVKNKIEILNKMIQPNSKKMKM